MQFSILATLLFLPIWQWDNVNSPTVATKPAFASTELSKDILSKLGSIQSPLADSSQKGQKEFKSEPYLLAAIEMQNLSSEKREAILKELSKPRAGYQEQVIVLCRMLYVANEGTVMRRAGLGGPSVLGGVDYKKLKCDPIEMVDGVPFLVVSGYILGGRPESAGEYLEYCIANCQWTDYRYGKRMGGDYKAAATKLIRNWPKELGEHDKKFILSQVQ